MPSEHEAHDVYITACGTYLPGEPIGNDQMELFLGRVPGQSSAIKHRILQSNGIKSRHYALSTGGHTTELNEELAAGAIRRALASRGMALADVEMLALGTTLGDVLIPGFASMVQGRLKAPPMEVLSAGGVCCSGMAAMQAAFRALRVGHRRVAVAGGSELVSRALRASRLDPEVCGTPARGLEFDREFIRWMLSDGAGVVLLEQTPRPEGLSLRVDWTDFVSRAGENAPCMHAGMYRERPVAAGSTWLDLPAVAEAERQGLLCLRQNIRMLDRMVELGVEHWLRLVRSGLLVPDQIDHVVCHYSSTFFRERILVSLADAGLLPSRGKWFSNLERKGNTGSASVFIALDELWASGELKVGDRIIVAVPESARFASCVAQLTVVDAATARPSPGAQAFARTNAAPLRSLLSSKGAEFSSRAAPFASAPAAADREDTKSPLNPDLTLSHRRLLVDLGLVWAEFNALLHQLPFVQRVEQGLVSLDDYRRFLRHLRQQVADGSRWITRAASSTGNELSWLRSKLIQHALEEHRDYELLEHDYVAVGGDVDEIRSTPMNLGSEALSAFIFQRASLPNPIDLAGAMFIIEGLGLRVAAWMVDRLVEHLGLTDAQTSFLSYHGRRDATHLGELEEVLKKLPLDDVTRERIVRTARTTARLYVLQLEEIEFEGARGLNDAQL